MTRKQLQKQQARARRERERERRDARKAREAALKARRKAMRAARAAPGKSLAAWSKQVRARAYNTCEVCGATEHLQAHHILPKERYQLLKLEVINGVCLCPTCHKFGKYSAHRNPLWFVLFLKKHCSERYNWCKRHL